MACHPPSLFVVDQIPVFEKEGIHHIDRIHVRYLSSHFTKTFDYRCDLLFFQQAQPPPRITDEMERPFRFVAQKLLVEIGEILFVKNTDRLFDVCQGVAPTLDRRHHEFSDCDGVRFPKSSGSDQKVVVEVVSVGPGIHDEIVLKPVTDFVELPIPLEEIDGSAFRLFETLPVMGVHGAVFRHPFQQE